MTKVLSQKQFYLPRVLSALDILNLFASNPEDESELDHVAELAPGSLYPSAR